MAIGPRNKSKKPEYKYTKSTFQKDPKKIFTFIDKKTG